MLAPYGRLWVRASNGDTNLTRRIDLRRPEASGIPKIKISETFDLAISTIELSADIFVDLLREVSHETVPFETISGKAILQKLS